jgi:hypothetical protein
VLTALTVVAARAEEVTNGGMAILLWQRDSKKPFRLARRLCLFSFQTNEATACLVRKHFCIELE